MPKLLSKRAKTPVRKYIKYAKYYDKNGHFIPQSSGYMGTAEIQERKYQAHQDLKAQQDGFDYILSMCKEIRGGHWKCYRNPIKELNIGCRNYVVALQFEDGIEWLMKTAQPPLIWSSYQTDVHQLRAEIAVMHWVRKTSIPVPKLFAWNTFSDAKNNPFGRPFYIMEKVQGKTFDEKKRDAEKKDYKGISGSLGEEKVIKQMAKFYMDMMKHPFEKKGKLALKPSAYAWKTKEFLGKQTDINSTVCQKDKGDCQTLEQQTLRRIDLRRKSFAASYTKGKMPIEDLKKMIALFKTIQDILPDVINEQYQKGPPFYLIHGDLMVANFLVDEEWNVTGIIDWELAKIVSLQETTTTMVPHEESYNALNNCWNNKNKIQERLAHWEEHQDERRYYRNRYIHRVKKLDKTVRLPISSGTISRMFDYNEQIQAIESFLVDQKLLSMESREAKNFYVERINNRLLGAYDNDSDHSS